MKLFDEFEAVKFSEENMILITKKKYLYYIYHCKRGRWQKYDEAGNLRLTIQNYPEVSRQELEDAMQGAFPRRETDFMRLCNPAQLTLSNMLALLWEDHPIWIADQEIYRAVYFFLSESDLCHVSFEKIRQLLRNASALGWDSRQVLCGIRELCLAVTGREVDTDEIPIWDRQCGISYFRVMPTRIIDPAGTDDQDNVAEMRSAAISLDEDDVDQYLMPFLHKHFDKELAANRMRLDADGFEWYLTHNFFTFDSMADMVREIKDTAEAMSLGRENEFTGKLKEKWRDTVEIGRIVDFYRRFAYRIEYMVNISRENGYQYISFMGP